MIDEKLKAELLESVNQSIRDSFKQNVILGNHSNLNQIANMHSGALRIYPSIQKKFNLILSMPEILSVFDWHDVRCCLCEQVIRYPCWYYSIKYAVNHFHYFVCFDSDSREKPSTKCYRRDSND